MSVIVQVDEITQIADALLYDEMGARDYRHIFAGKDEITAWSNRLYIATQIAYMLTYAHRAGCDMTMQMLPDEREWKHGGHLLQDLPRFYRMLESVRYNLYSNGGQVMFSAEDMTKLNDLIAVIGRGIVGLYQKEIGRVE